MSGAQPRWLNRTITFRQVSVAIHRGVASNQPAHRVRHDVEFEIGALQPALQALDASDKFSRVADVVLPPVVWKDVESVLVTIRAGILPVTLTIARVATQCFKQIAIDVDLGKHPRKTYCLNNFSRHEIVAIGGEIRTDRQSFLRSAKGGRPDSFTCFWVDQFRTQNSRNHDHRTFSGPGASRCEDVFEVRRAARRNTCARDQRKY